MHYVINYHTVEYNECLLEKELRGAFSATFYIFLTWSNKKPRLSSSDAVLTKQRASGQDHKGGKM